MPESITVLHVDDEADQRALFERYLERRDGQVDVESFADPRAALDRLDGSPPIDCVVCDYEMPGLDGLDVLGAVRERDEALPFVLFTGKGSEEIASEAISAGASDYLQKESGTDHLAVLLNRIHSLVERYRAQRRLRIERDRYSALFENTTDAIAFCEYQDGAPIIRSVNPAFETTFGYDADELVGRSIDEIIAPTDRHEEAARISERVREGDYQEHEVRRRTADGVRDFLVRSVPAGPAGSGEQAYAVYTDITDRRARERRLGALHSATRELMEATTREEIADIAIEAATRVLELEIAAVYCPTDAGDALVPIAATDAAPDLFGELPEIPEGEGVAWTVYESGDPVASDDIREHADVYNPDTSVRSEFVIPLGAHGVFMSGATTPGALSEADRSLASVLAANVEAAIDRAEREGTLRTRERELSRQNERLEDFAGIVSHDLRTPLSVVEGHLELLHETGEERHFESAMTALARADEIIEDVLALAREGKLVTSPEPVDLGEVANSAWVTVSTIDATLEVASTATVRADADRLRQLLENCFANAVQHGADGDPLTITVRATDEGFVVADDGAGIAPTVEDELFEAGVTTAEDGTGFGLSIVQAIAEAHGWSVSIRESKAGGAAVDVTGVERVQAGDD